jgi:hypothetical protein
LSLIIFPKWMKCSCILPIMKSPTSIRLRTCFHNVAEKWQLRNKWSKDSSRLRHNTQHLSIMLVIISFRNKASLDSLQKICWIVGVF